MKSSLECLPCQGNLAVNLARRLTDDAERQHAVLADALRYLADCDMAQPPPCHAGAILRHTLPGFPGKDPYLAEKNTSTELARRLASHLKQHVDLDLSDFETRLRLAIAGNILDFGIYMDLDIQAAMESIRETLAKPIDEDAARRLKARIDSASNILYLLDNCGEAVFDRIFLEPFRSKVTLAVRGQPTLNDVTEDDLEPSGLGGGFVPRVVHHATCIPGVFLPLAGDEFRRAFAEADLIIAKGQGNFETLSDTDRPVAFLFLAKCPVVVRELNVPPRSIQVRLVNC